METGIDAEKVGIAYSRGGWFEGYPFLQWGGEIILITSLAKTKQYQYSPC